MSKQRVVIIGAGMAGLAAAVRLAEDGRFEPRLLEHEAEPGGLARSLRIGEFTTDLGPHRIHSEDPQIMDFIRQVAGPDLVRVPRASHMFLRGGFLRYPPDPWGLAARLGPLRLARFAASYALARLRPPASPETYQTLMRRAFGPELYDFLLGPFTAKTWKTDPAALHADVARTRISAGSLARLAGALLGRTRPGQAVSLKELHYVRGGMKTLVRNLWQRAAAAGARLEPGCAVRALELNARGCVAAALAETANGPARFEADAFISTAPLPGLLGDLLPAAPELAAARAAAAGLGFLDIILIYLIVRRPRISADTWLYFPEPGFIFNRAYEAKNFDPALGPHDRTILCLEITHRPGDDTARQSDESLIETASGQICATGLFTQREIEQAVAVRVPFAYPLYTLDYRERLNRTVAGLAKIPNLLSCGRQGLFIHNNMDHSIGQGLAAADALAREGPAAAPDWYAQLDRFKQIRIVD